MLVYADTSALVKLIVNEKESRALARFIGGVDVLISSRITQVEFGIAAVRNSTEADEAARAIDQLVFRELTLDISSSAARLAPPGLRSFDAVHLATALELLPELDAFLTYDKRLADAARQHGLTVASPA